MSGRGLRRRKQEPALRVAAPPMLLDVLRDGPAPLEPGGPADPARLSVAFVVPSFRRVSGGHTSIAALVRALEARGHACSVWIVADRPQDGLERAFAEWFGPVAGPVHASFDAWQGADVVVATAWQTVPEVLRRPRAHARVYFVQDHEPDFYGASPERLWSEWTYRQGLHPVATSPWLERLLAERYGSPSSPFAFGIERDVYAPRPVRRRDDLVLFYARPVTPRRGTALGLLALAELKRRRPHVEVALFGERETIDAGFEHTNLGVLERGDLADAYSDATVGMALSFTNPSLIPKEMLACGLPCVEVDVDPTRGAYPADAPVAFAAPDPASLCAALEGLLDAGDQSQRAVASVAPLTWERAGEMFETGLRAALA